MLRFNETPIWGMGTSFDKNPDRALVGWAANTCFFCFFFWCLVLWILLPSSCVWVPQLQTDRRELSKQTCQVSQASPVHVSKAGLPEKEKSCSWKTSKLLAFCLLRSLWRKWCWGSRCLLLVTWIHWVFGFLWWWRKKGTWGERSD